MDAVLARAPVYGADIFDPAALRSPFEHYRALRDLGPVARLSHPDVYVLSRYDAVRDALRAPDALISGKGVGFSNEFNTPGGPNLIQSDGDLHGRMKTEVLRPLNVGALKPHRPLLKDLIATRIGELVDGGPFDAIAEIARGQGEDLSRPESALACLEVFALGPEGARGAGTRFRM